MIKVDKSIISSLNPCSNRFDNYVKHYGDRSFTKAQFMGLKSITQGDKLWVSLRLMPKENIALAAADIAESVLHIFEAKYPNDDRPRKAIEAVRTKNPKAADAAYAADVHAAHAAHDAYAAAYAVPKEEKPKQEKLIHKILMRYWK